MWMYIASIGRHSDLGSEAICEHRQLCRCKSQDNVQTVSRVLSAIQYSMQEQYPNKTLTAQSSMFRTAKLLAMVMPDNSINPPSIRHGDGFSFLRDDPVVSLST